VKEDFSSYTIGSHIDTWNLYSPMWARVSLTRTEVEGKCLRLKDADPYDRSRAMRVFPAWEAGTVNTRIYLDSKSQASQFTLELQNQYGMAAVRLYFTNKGELVVKNGGRYDTVYKVEMGAWLDLTIKANCLTNRFSVSVAQDGRTFEKKFRFSLSVSSLERILYASKASLPFNTVEDCGKYGDLGDLENADVRLEESVYYISTLQVQELPSDAPF
jgi:hypothetical protein